MTLFNQLNEPQRDAVETLDGPLLVLAGAGSGKTRVVTFRIINLLANGVSPDRILGLTFTNKAAGEMKERVHQLSQSNVLICTFHSLGARILRERITELGFKSDFTIYDENDCDKVIKACLVDIGASDQKLDTKGLKHLISRAKNNMSGPDTATISDPESDTEKLFPRVYAHYQQKLKEFNALDFDDLLYLPVRLFREHPEVLGYYQNRWRFLLIDEYQDTNEAQYEMIRLLVEKSRNICVVGDPDQSIYSWRGANIHNILEFEKDYPGAKIVRLEQNYRSRSNILEAANAVICHNEGRYQKNLWSDLGQGERIKYFTADNERGEAAFITERIRHHYNQDSIPLHEMVVFYRTNAQSRVFEDTLLTHRIPYVIVGGVSFYQRREIKDIIAFLRMVQTSSDYISFERTINIPKRGLGDTTIEKLRQGSNESNMPILGFCEALAGGDFSAGIKLTAKQKEGLRNYLAIIHELREINKTCSLRQVVERAIELSGYLNYIKEDKETFDDRKGNLDALISKSVEWESLTEEPSLARFLEDLTLRSSLDEAGNDRERVNLMTIHNGKGLEFTVTFLAGLEEDLFPHANSRKNAESVEEERRLFYVGMTRAKEYLYISNATQRFLWGAARLQKPSRFIHEIPFEYKEKIRRSHEIPRMKKNIEVEEPFSDEITRPAFTAAPAEILKAGDAIFHKEFGIGVINSVYDGSAGLTYKIAFAKGNKEKNIVAKYAPLQRL